MYSSRSTGVDLSKILGGQTKILGGKVVKSDKCMDVSQLFMRHVPGLPPKSTPMSRSSVGDQTAFHPTVSSGYYLLLAFSNDQNETEV